MGTEISPGQMGKLGVDRAGDHLCIDGLKLVHTIAECNDLSWADKCAAKDTQKKHINKITYSVIKQFKQYKLSDYFICVPMLLTSPEDRRKRQCICLCSRTTSPP